MRTSRTSASLVVIFCALAMVAQEKPKSPLDILETIGEGGEKGSQPVTDPSANAQLEVELLPESAQARMGETFRFDVTVEGDPVMAASNVLLELRPSIRRDDATGSQDVRFVRISRKTGDSDAEIDCPGAGEARTCSIDVIGAGAHATIIVTLRTNPNARPGELVLSARALIGQTTRSSGESVVQLLEKAKLSNVGLTLTLESQSDVGAPGLEVDQTILVRNTSKQENATDVVLTVRQRLIVTERAGVQRLPNDQFTTVLSNVVCKEGEEKLQCALGTIKPGSEFRVPVQTTIRAELRPRSRGALETRASVVSAERDPQPGDNRAKSSTNIISRQPELAFISQVTNDRGLPEFVRQHSVSRGQVFRIAARYGHVLVDPTDEELSVRLMVNNAQPTTVALRRSAIPGDRVFRSEPFILLSPQDNADAGKNVTLRAAAGSVLKARSGNLEVSVPVQ